MRKETTLLLGVTAGFTIWAIGFVALYSALSVGCQFNWDGTRLMFGVSLQRVQLVVITVLILGSGWIAVHQLSPRKKSRLGFLQTIAHRSALAALFSSIAVFGAVFVITPC